MTSSARATVTRIHAPVPLATVQGTLALDLLPLLDPPAPSAAPGRPGCDLVAVDDDVRDELERWVGRYVQGAIEAVAGDRPPSQLSRWTRREVHRDLVRRAELVARAGNHRPGQGRRTDVVRPQVVSVRLAFLEDGVVEASARVRHGERSRAVAARFETFRDRWVCSAIEFC